MKTFLNFDRESIEYLNSVTNHNSLLLELHVVVFPDTSVISNYGSECHL